MTYFNDLQHFFKKINLKTKNVGRELGISTDLLDSIFSIRNRQKLTLYLVYLLGITIVVVILIKLFY